MNLDAVLPRLTTSPSSRLHSEPKVRLQAAGLSQDSFVRNIRPRFGTLNDLELGQQWRLLNSIQEDQPMNLKLRADQKNGVPFLVSRTVDDFPDGKIQIMQISFNDPVLQRQSFKDFERYTALRIEFPKKELSFVHPDLKAPQMKIVRAPHLGDSIAETSFEQMMLVLAVQLSQSQGFEGRLKWRATCQDGLNYAIKMGFKPVDEPRYAERMTMLAELKDKGKYSLPYDLPIYLMLPPERIKQALKQAETLDKALPLQEADLQAAPWQKISNITQTVPTPLTWAYPESPDQKLYVNKKGELTHQLGWGRRPVAEIQQKIQPNLLTGKPERNYYITVRENSKVEIRYQRGKAQLEAKHPKKLREGDEIQIGNTLYVATEKGLSLLTEDAGLFNALFPNPGLQFFQGKIGDCYFLASFLALYNNPVFRTLIPQWIRENENGDYVVTFPGFPADEMIVDKNNPNLQDGVRGPLGIQILETAFGMLRHRYLPREKQSGVTVALPLHHALHAGQPAEAFYALTGISPQKLSLLPDVITSYDDNNQPLPVSPKEQELARIVERLNTRTSDIVAVIDTRHNGQYQKEGGQPEGYMDPGCQVLNGHALTVKNANKKEQLRMFLPKAEAETLGDIVTIVDPHDSFSRVWVNLNNLWQWFGNLTYIDLQKELAEPNEQA